MRRTPVVVTAEKRETTASKTPIAMDVFNAEQMLKSDRPQAAPPRFPGHESPESVRSPVLIRDVLHDPDTEQPRTQSSRCPPGVHDPARLGLLTAIASLGVSLGTLIFRGLARLPIGVLLCLEFVVSGVGFVWMGKAADPAGFVLAAAVNTFAVGQVVSGVLVTFLAEHVGGLLPAFIVLGMSSAAAAALALAGQWLFTMPRSRTRSSGRPLRS